MEEKGLEGKQNKPSVERILNVMLQLLKTVFAFEACAIKVAARCKAPPGISITPRMRF